MLYEVFGRTLRQTKNYSTANARKWTERNDRPEPCFVVRGWRDLSSGTVHLRSFAVEIPCFPGPARQSEAPLNADQLHPWLRASDATQPGCDVRRVWPRTEDADRAPRTPAPRGRDRTSSAARYTHLPW